MTERAIKKHLTSGELSLTGTEYRCNTCQQSLGQQPLLHINGAPHKNRVFTQIVQNPSRYPSLYAGLPTIITQAHKKGIIKVSSSNLQCVPCGKSLSGESPVIDHLRSKNHEKLVTGIHLKPTSTKQSPGQTFDSSVFPQEVHTALKDGTIEVLNEQGIKKFLCKFCNSTMTGDVPLQQHLTGHTHRKNVKDHALSACRPPPQTYADNGPKQFHVNTRVVYRRSPTAYSLTTTPRGLVAIFNYTFKETKNPRKGAEVDEVNLKSVFQQMNYEVIVHRDCNRSNTLQNFRYAHQKASRYSAFLAFFLSHGSSPDSFHCTQDSSITVHELCMILTDSNAPGLVGKPKILLFNYCRGTIEQANIRFDGVCYPVLEAPKNLALVQATLPLFKAKRHESFGTFFVESLCEILEQDACKSNLMNIIYNTSQLMQKKGGTTATVLPVDFVEFFFL